MPSGVPCFIFAHSILMPLIIDGYNLLHASGILGRGKGPGHLERARQALLNFLVESLPEKELTKTVVVFDAVDPPWGLPRRVNHSGVQVVFASHHSDADSHIEEMIEENSAPKRLTVVSSDHRLHRAAKRRKATAIDSDRWFAEQIRSRSERASANSQRVTKPDGGLSDIEVEYWLKHFGMDEKK